MWLKDNWLTLVIDLILIAEIIKQVYVFMNKSKEQKIEIIKAKINEIMLNYVKQAEDDYSDVVKAGALKRAQVIQQLYTDYPELSTVINQEEVINYLDESIDNALKTLREIIKENSTEEV
jgi:hypothetical protein